MAKEYWYRLEARSTSPLLDEYGQYLSGSGGVEFQLWQYEVLKHTPRGAWLKLGIDVVPGRDITDQQHVVEKRFVLRDCRKRFACPTIGEAVESFIARKTRQASIYRARAATADMMISRAKYKYHKELRSDTDELVLA